MRHNSLGVSAVSVLALAAAITPAYGQTEPSPTAELQNAPASTQTAATGASTTSNDIVVTGVRASLRKALQIKRASTQVIDSIVAEDIGKLPDNNVVEALQRVTGVQVTNRNGGEVGAISIRGLPDITTTLNGRNIFTASGREFDLTSIPSNLVRRIDVYKTRSAEELETGIAGQVDVFTRRPFDFDGFAVSAYARGIYQKEDKSYNPNLSALVSDRWETGIGDVGLLINGSYQKTKYRDQGLTPGALVPYATADDPAAGWSPLERYQPTDPRAPGQTIWQPGLNSGLPEAAGSTFTINGQQVPYYLSRDAMFQNDLRGTRVRPSVNAALQWSPNDSSTYTAEFFWDEYKLTTYNDLFFTLVDNAGSLGSDPGSSFTLYPGTNIIKSRTVGDAYNFTSGDYTQEKTDSFVYALNGKWDVGSKLKLTADASYQNSIFNEKFLATRADRVANQETVTFNTGNGLPAFGFDNNAIIKDPATWNLAQFYDNAYRNKGSAYTFQGDGKWDVGTGFLRKISFGVRYDNRRSSEAQRTQTANNVPGLSLADLPAGALFTNSGFFDGMSDVPTSWVAVNGYYVAQHADAIRQLYLAANPGFETSDQLQLTTNFRINEITTAAYVQANAEQEIFGRPLKLEAGVRFVNVDTRMHFTDLLSGDLSNAKNQVHTFLPSATAIYEITNNLRARANFGKTLRRPNFTDLNPNFILTGDLSHVGYGTGTAGNPKLTATKSKNYDLGLEWYFDKGNAIYATAFRRDISGLVVPIRQVYTIENSGQNTNTFVVTQPANASKGYLKGIEVGTVYFPNFLPGLLNGLGVNASLTLLDSSQNIPISDTAGNVVGQQKTQFFGVSKFSYNITMAYDHGPVGARLSYVWRKKFFLQDEAALFANPIGIYRHNEKDLDLQLNYNLTKRLAVSFDATNLTNELQQAYYQFGDAGGPGVANFGNNILGRTFALGVRYSFN